MNWTLAGIVVAFLVVAGAFLYLSSRGDSDGGGVTAQGGNAEPTAPAENLGGAPQAGVGGKPVGNVEKDVVPDLAGVRVDDAIVALREAEIDYLIVETDAATGTPGVISSQSPSPGTEADGGTSVTLVVPRG
jgi:hypothetical protein